MSPSEKTRDMPDIGDITNIGDFFTEFSLFNRISDNGSGMFSRDGTLLLLFR